MNTILATVSQTPMPKYSDESREDFTVMMNITFLSVFFGFILFKYLSSQTIITERFTASIENLEQHQNGLESQVIDMKNEINELKQSLEQNREDINMILFSFKHSDFKIRCTSAQIPDILRLASYVLDRENIINKETGKAENYEYYKELSSKID
jgi:hypothetical protein